MDEQELERLASNNPAMTVPASTRVSRSNNNDYAAASNASTATKSQTQPRARVTQQQHHDSSDQSTVTASDPAGDVMRVTKETSSSSTTPSDSSPPAAAARSDNTDEVVGLSKYDRGWRRVVRNFSPSWFSVTMGTGISGLLLITIPFKAAWLYWLSVVFFGLNTILFASAFTLSFLRYTLYPEIWTVMVHDPTNSLFLGCPPIGFATLVEAWIFLCCPYWGPWATTFAWVCWMVDAVAAFAVTVGLSYMLMSQSHLASLERITAAQLLPIAATIVAAGTGAEVAETLPNKHHAIGTLLTSYVMWGMSTPLAMVVLVIYYQRLAVHKLPPREVIVSVFLPLGPLGMGGYTIMYLGRVARDVLPHVSPLLTHVAIAGDVLYLFGIMVALIMWGFGLTWLCFALATIWRSRPFPFNMGWWGFTFPLGVMATSTITFGTELPSMFFKVLGTIFSVCVILLWAVVFVGTAKGAWNGKLFYAPCLRNLAKDQHPPPSPPISSGSGDKPPTGMKDLEKGRG